LSLSPRSSPHPSLDRSGLIFDLVRFSLHNGPGIRTTVFLKGCPLSCPWCHNPESQSHQPEMLFVAGRCISCRYCCSVCHSGALHWDDGPLRDAIRCTLCGACVQVCPADARHLMGKRTDVPELMSAIRRDVLFFDESGGGVTFSGGEPLSQPGFLEAALLACKLERLHTVVDTCGYAPSSVLLRLISYVDLFLFDLKFASDARHLPVVGVSNAPILANLALLVSEHRDVVVRIPVIPGINDDDENLQQSFDILSNLGIRRVDLLPFHEAGVEKYRRLALPYRLGQVQPPSSEVMQELAARFSDRGFEIKIGG
jgi:pyruvate formate lyase activating enzyme